MSQLTSNPPYDDTIDIREWLADLEDYFLAKFDANLADERKLAFLRQAFGKAHRGTVKEVISRLTAAQQTNYDAVKNAVIARFEKKSSVIVERHQFHQMYQQNGESIDSFVSRLREQAAKCNFVYTFEYTTSTATDAGVQNTVNTAVKDISDEMIRDRVVVAVNEETTKAQLFKEPNLTLNTAIEIIRALEDADDYIKKINDTKSVDAVFRNKKNKHVPQKPHFNKKGKPQSGSGSVNGVSNNSGCSKCGMQHELNKCPARGKLCLKCNKKNHFAKMCYDKSVNAVDENEIVVQESFHAVDPGDLFMGLIDISKSTVIPELSSSKDISSISNDWNESVLLDGCPVDVKIDTGAQTNVISEQVLKKILPDSIIKPSTVTLSAYGGTKIPVSGSCDINCEFDGEVVKTSFIVVPLVAKTVLGLQSCSQLGIVNFPCRISKCEEISESADEKCSETITPLHNHVNPPHACVNVNSECAAITHPTPTNFKERTLTQTDKQTNNNISPSLRKVLAEYEDVFTDDKLGLITEYPYKITLSKNAVPVIHPLRKIAFSIRDKVEKEIDRMLKLGAIEPVDKPTEWVNSMAIVEKPETGDVRICLDPTSLNKYVMREHTTLPTEEEMLSQLEEATMFSKLDAKDGYWQVPLEEETSYLTTFNTHLGRYRYKRLPFGLNSSNEVFQKKMVEVFKGLPGIVVMYDDILIYGKHQTDHDRHLTDALRRARDVGLKLNRRKCKFQMKEVKYVGHIIGCKGIKPDPRKVENLKNMEKPTDKTGVQRLLGSLNYLHKFIPNVSELTAPLRSLLVKGVEFNWMHEHDEALKKILDVLTSSPVLGYYDSKKDIVMTSDASQSGLGACILQESKPIAYASRSLTATQKNYAQIEKELLSIVFGSDRFHQYIYGKKVRVETDHKPLIPLFKRPLHDVPARIQRLMLRLQRYDLDVYWVPGKFMFIPDMLSRAPCAASSDDADPILEKEAEIMIHSIIQNLNCSSSMKDRIRMCTEQDEALKCIKYYIFVSGWPDRIENCNPSVKPYWQHRHSLSIFQDMVLFGDRIVIPPALRKEILGRIHSGHQGRERCKISARRVVYWPGMNAQIDAVVDKCEACLLTRSALPREPLKPHPIPDHAWQKIACDMFVIFGEKWQIVTDFFSKWIEIRQMPCYNATGSDVVDHLKSLFSHYGRPREIFSDGDFLYTSNVFKNMCIELEIDHIFSSAKYPQSNGMIENSVKHAKNLISRCRHSKDDLYNALLEYRNTPLSNLVGSPAQLFLNRNLRSSVPCVDDFLLTKSDVENRKMLVDKKSKAEFYYNRTAQNELPEYQPGDIVKYRDSQGSKVWQSGQILRPSNSDHRSYELVNTRGRTIKRNNRYLIPDKTDGKFVVVPDVVRSRPEGPVQGVSDPPATVSVPVNQPPVAMSQETPVVRRSARLASKAPVSYSH